LWRLLGKGELSKREYEYFLRPQTDKLSRFRPWEKINNK